MKLLVALRFFKFKNHLMKTQHKRKQENIYMDEEMYSLEMGMNVSELNQSFLLSLFRFICLYIKHRIAKG